MIRLYKNRSRKVKISRRKYYITVVLYPSNDSMSVSFTTSETTLHIAQFGQSSPMLSTVQVVKQRFQIWTWSV